MSTLLKQDQSLRPEIFIWNGSITEEQLDEWLSVRQLKIPDDLAQLWRETGGGDLFEGETILGPFGDSSSGSDIDSVNESYRRRGLSREYLIVHIGSAMTAIRLRDGKWVTLDQDTYQETGEYNSLADWYQAVLHMEFAGRYGLSL